MFDNVLGQSDNRIQTLCQVSSFIDVLQDRREQSNIAAGTSLLAGLVLKKDVIRRVLREEIMRESVIYQDIKAQGQASLIVKQLRRSLGEIRPEDESRITDLSVQQLEDLGEALLDFSSGDDLSAWLANIQS